MIVTLINGKKVNRKPRKGKKIKVFIDHTQLVKFQKTSAMEEKISAYLYKLKINHEREKEFWYLYNPKTGIPLRYDFYIPFLNLIIEYDGIHHFKNEDKTKLDKQRYRDSIKDKFCQDNNIHLLRIPYTKAKSYISIINNKIIEVTPAERRQNAIIHIENHNK